MNNSVAVGAGEEGNPRYSGFFETSFVITNNPAKADLAVRVDREAAPGIAIVKEVQDIHNKYPYTMNLGIKEIRRKLHKAKVSVWYRGEEKDDFNKFHWDKFVRFYGMKSDERYSHNRALKGENPSYVYSQQAIELMVQEIMRDPKHVIDSMVASLSKKK